MVVCTFCFWKKQFPKIREKPNKLPNFAHWCEDSSRTKLKLDLAVFDMAFQFIRTEITFYHVNYQLQNTLPYLILFHTENGSLFLSVFPLVFFGSVFRALILTCVGFKDDFDVKSWPNTFRSMPNEFMTKIEPAIEFHLSVCILPFALHHSSSE